MSGEHYPWAAIRHDYVTGNLPYGELAKKYGVSRLRTLTDRASLEHWVDLRKEYRERVARKAASKAATRASTALSRHKLAADRLMDKLDAMLGDEASDADALLTAKAFKNLVQGLKDLVAIQRDLYDIPTGAELFQRNLATEKLIMEQERAAADAGGSDAVTVEFSGEAAQWAE